MIAIYGIASKASSGHADITRAFKRVRSARESNDCAIQSLAYENMAMATEGAGHMAKSRDARFLCVVDGDIYNSRGVYDKLKQVDGSARSHGTADVILRCYLSGDREILKTLTGAFVFAILDTKKKEVIVGRDAFGNKVVYYSNTPNGLIFSSSLTALADSSWTDKEIDKDGLVRYLAGGYISAPYTIYRHIRLLEPGDLLVYKNGEYRIDSFSRFEPDSWKSHDIGDATAEELTDRFETLLSDAIKCRLPETRQVALYLSGGRDTSLLCGALRKHADKEIVAYTLGLKGSRNDESEYARAVAKHLNIKDHELHYLTKEDFFGTLTELPEIYGQPLGDISAIPTNVMTRKLSQRFDSVFCGDGPDFMFGNFDFKLLYHYYKWVPRRFRKSFSSFVEFAIQKFFYTWTSPNLSVPELLKQPDLFWIFEKKFKAEMLEKILGEPVDAWSFEAHRFLESRRDIPISERMLLVEHMFYGLDDVLYKATCSHNVYSVRLLRPYYDSGVFEFSRYLPTKYKFRKGRGRYLQNRLLSKLIPIDLINRPKRGFIVDFVEFGTADLKSLTDKYLSRKRLNETGLINADFAVKCVEDYYNGNLVMGPKLWVLLIFELWRERFSI
jgi:asparagine synthase (glutamine-hydrolysing)